MNGIVHFVSSFVSLYTVIFSPGTQPLYAQASSQACCAAPPPTPRNLQGEGKGHKLGDAHNACCALSSQVLHF